MTTGTTVCVAMDDELLVLAGGDGRWEPRTRLQGRAPRSLAPDPRRHGRLWCGTSGSGLWRTEDAGDTWHRAWGGPAGAHVSAVATDGERGVVYAGTDPSALYRSDDDGASWNELPTLLDLPSAPTWSFPPRPDTSHVRWITLDPRDPDRLFVCIEAGALVRSADGGRTWTDRVPGGPYDTHTLAAHPAAPGRLYSAAGDGFGAPGKGYCESRDGGDTWERPGDGLELHYLWGLAVDAADPDTVLVSAASSPRSAHAAGFAESRVYRRAGGQPWQRVGIGLPEPRGTTRAVLAAHPAEPGVFFAASNRGLFRSGDGGTSWERLDVPWPAAYERQAVSALAVAGPGIAG